MLVHGGPWVRGADLSWDERAQYLAALGYRVIEPEFRGSSGYGAKLLRAGDKQWGLRMQDDLVDALAWAAKQGLVDDKRACIMGSSYGGYAALMGPIRDPQAYRCAISFAGVTDIKLRFDAWNSDMSSEAEEFILPELMGDPATDTEMLDKSSPLARVKEIKVPVLLAHGLLDRRVPIDHAREFVSAAKAAGVDIDYVLYEQEAHGFTKLKDEADYYRRVGACLAQHLGAASGAKPPSPDPKP